MVDADLNNVGLKRGALPKKKSTTDGSASTQTLSEDVSKQEEWNFDENGRVQNRTLGVNMPMSYIYNVKTSQVNHIEGGSQLQNGRDASQENSFMYDLDGRMVYDVSKLLEIRWGLSGAVQMTKHTGVSNSTSEHALYGPDGWRVAEVTSLYSSMGSPDGPIVSNRVASIRLETRLNGRTYGESTPRL